MRSLCLELSIVISKNTAWKSTRIHTFSLKNSNEKSLTCKYFHFSKTHMLELSYWLTLEIRESWELTTKQNLQKCGIKMAVNGNQSQPIENVLLFLIGFHTLHLNDLSVWVTVLGWTKLHTDYSTSRKY